MTGSKREEAQTENSCLGAWGQRRPLPPAGPDRSPQPASTGDLQPDVHETPWVDRGTAAPHPRSGVAGTPRPRRDSPWSHQMSRAQLQRIERNRILSRWQILLMGSGVQTASLRSRGQGRARLIPCHLTRHPGFCAQNPTLLGSRISQRCFCVARPEVHSWLCPPPAHNLGHTLESEILQVRFTDNRH